jgi:D-alanine-D-alanine ligase
MTTPSPTIVVLCGGVSAEREVSLGSGRASSLALARSFPTRLVDVGEAGLPAGLDPARDVIFSTLHGTFGEDGAMQTLLDAAGVHYAGCDAASSALTFDKERTKQAVAAAGVRVAAGVSFPASRRPTTAALAAGLERALAGLADGEWLAEQRIRGRELTVGLLNGKAMGVVEIVPQTGTFDYTSKYTKGLTQYLAPAPLSDAVTAAAQSAAERAFAACGCRDYARIDFMLSPRDELFLLEINTLPGMKDTSLLPMSARCAGLDFTELVRELVTPALRRFRGGTR